MTPSCTARANKLRIFRTYRTLIVVGDHNRETTAVPKNPTAGRPSSRVFEGFGIESASLGLFLPYTVRAVLKVSRRQEISLPEKASNFIS
jgi:hypothetical protein